MRRKYALRSHFSSNAAEHMGYYVLRSNSRAGTLVVRLISGTAPDSVRCGLFLMIVKQRAICGAAKNIAALFFLV
ncbi:hypothetical protein [Paraburkholderia phenoliruptrix]|uniref:hypothetical protein n=1 Tax=Paraburkholderia phenoliruptrix TaxID=252970 RepID=UPI002869A908|nr:hypothetical protein [Paraburkholderia phenoliruptrix]WMY10957.1 hypothetical protein P3F88_30220 [Paraburkholderia phenoliruptrix]